MKLRNPFRKGERRNYTDEMIDSSLVTAQGGGIAVLESATALACASLWSRAFASAEVNHDAVTPEVMGDIGYDLIRHGESVWMADVVAGRIELTRASAWDVRGKNGWRYRLDLPSPDGTRSPKRLQNADTVIHCRWQTDRARPWAGLSPLRNCASSAVAALDDAMSNEAAGPHGQVMMYPVAQGAGTGEQSSGKLTKSFASWHKLAGGLIIQMVQTGGLMDYPSGMAKAPGKDWVPERVGYKPPVALAEIRQGVVTSVASACGVPIDLIAETKGSTGNRESLRQFLHVSLQPMAKRVGRELARVLETEIEINFDALMASDLSGRARAFQSMVGGGMDTNQAASLAGLMVNE